MKSKKIFGAIALISLGFLFIAPQIAQAAIGNQGRILYTKDVVRNTDGTIASTGNLFVKDLATNIEQQVTNYTGTFSILNPMFDADGKQIIYTSNVAVGSDTTYKIYLVSADASINVGVGIELQGGVGDINYKYAALSPDGNTIVFSYEDSDGMSLWAYDRKTHIYQQVYADSVNGIDIRDVVFVNNTTIAFIGKSQGIQNIYKTDLTGPTTIKITNNKDGGCGYLGLKSGVRSALAGDVLIYSKRIKPGSTWSPFDVYVTLSLDPFIEMNVTATYTSGQDEYEACFYGDDSATRDVQLTSTNGNMFYIAKVIGSKNKVWQANFDTAGGSTNTGKTQRTVDDDVAGQVDWAPPITEQAPTIGVDSTEIAFIGTDAQVKVGDFTDATTIDPIVTVTTPGTGIMGNPSLGAARIVYEVNMGGGSYIIEKMNSDGTNNDVFIDESTPGFTGKKVIRMPSISPDGKWVFFVAGTPTGNKQIYAKGINKSLGEAAIPLNIGSKAEDPVVSPDMSSLVWVENNAGKRTIYRISLSYDAENNITGVKGTAQILGGNNISENWSDKNPSFSPDGTKIIFVSDRDGSDKIYTMDAGTGLGVNLFPGLPSITNPAYPQYSPLNDGSIVFVADGPVVGQRVLYSSSGAILDSTGANIVVTGDKFSWNIERNPGDIIATRTLQSRASDGAELIYKIKIDVDEGKTPVSYTLNEVIPNWTVIDVWCDGIKLTRGTHYYVLSDTPIADLTTLKFVFSAIPGGSAGTVADHILTISVTAAGTGTKSFSGTIDYFMNGQAKSALVSGNGTLNILKPYCPVDKYNVKKEANKPDGIIQDLDLLYGIEAWSTNAQLPGYGTGWPADPLTNWDDIILAVINIWASPAGSKGHHSGTGSPVTEGSTVAGEYQYVGPNLYKPSAAGTEVQEMYWTQGMWSD
ncbi:MAG TPA: hypothetical protein P5025_00450 [Candidatus Ratteibacteria bacterium]|nr:hypothetical protein [Candidatus Ratteibacteria bacterium]